MVLSEGQLCGQMKEAPQHAESPPAMVAPHPQPGTHSAGEHLQRLEVGLGHQAGLDLLPEFLPNPASLLPPSEEGHSKDDGHANPVACQRAQEAGK